GRPEGQALAALFVGPGGCGLAEEALVVVLALHDRLDVVHPPGGEQRARLHRGILTRGRGRRNRAAYADSTARPPGGFAGGRWRARRSTMTCTPYSAAAAAAAPPTSANQSLSSQSRPTGIWEISSNA